MDILETLLRPITALINRQIRVTTPAQEICAELDGKVIAVRLKETGLAMYIFVCPDELVLFGNYEKEPDVMISGSIFALARLLRDSGDEAIRDGSLELTGDSDVAQGFRKLLHYAKPDVEEELSGVIGDVTAHRIGEIARNVAQWGKDAARTIQQNVTEYLQEERRDVPSRYEVETFTRQVDALRDDVARLEARVRHLGDPG